MADRVLDWPGDARGRGDALPLRLAGALHGLVIEERDTGLAAVYPPCDADDDGALGGRLRRARRRMPARSSRRLDGPPQTNEPSAAPRSAPGC